MSSTSSVLSLTDFTAYDLPTKPWLRFIRPKFRLRVRLHDHDHDHDHVHAPFVSPVVKVVQSRDQAQDLGSSMISWAWEDPLSRPSFADDQVFEVEVERRFLLWYKRICRTKPATLDQVRTVDHCALPLYDGQVPVEALEDRIEIGEITFSLQRGDEEASVMDQVSTTYP